METLNKINNDINKEDGELSTDDDNDYQPEFVITISHSAQSSRKQQTTQRGRNASFWNDFSGNMNQYGVQNSRSFRSVHGRGFKGYRRSYDCRQSSIFRRSKSPKFFINRRYRSPSLGILRSPRRTLLSGAKKMNRKSRHELQKRKIITNNQDELERLQRQRKKIREQLKDLENEELSGFDSLLDAVEALEDLDGVALEVQDVHRDTDKQSTPLILDIDNSTVLDYTLKEKNEGADLYKLPEESPEEDVGVLSSEPLKSQTVQEWHQQLEIVKILATESPILALEQLVTFSKEWDGIGRDIVVELIKDIKNSSYQDATEIKQDNLSSAYASSVYAQNISRHDIPQVCSPPTSQSQFQQPPQFTPTPIRQHPQAHSWPTAYIQEPLWDKEQLRRENTSFEMPKNMSNQRISSDVPKANPFHDSKLLQQNIAVQTPGNYLPGSANRIFLNPKWRDFKEVDKSFPHPIKRQLHIIQHNADEHHHSQNKKQNKSSIASAWKSTIIDSEITKYNKNERNIEKYSSPFDDFLTSQENYNNQHADESKTGHRSSNESGCFDFAGQRTLQYTSRIGSTHHLSNKKDEYTSQKPLKNNRSSQNFKRISLTEKELIPPRRHFSLDHITINVSDSVDQSGNNRRVMLTDSPQNRRASYSSHEQQTSTTDIKNPSNSLIVQQKRDLKSKYMSSTKATLQTPPTKKVKISEPSPKILTSNAHTKALIDASVPENYHANDSSDSEDEEEQRKKLLESMRSKRETVNKAHQSEIIPSVALPKLDTSNSEPSGTPISMGTGEELSEVEHQDKVQSPSSVNNVFQENSEKDVQPFPGLSLSNVKEPQSQVELCQTKLSTTESPHKSDSQSQDQHPVQIDRQFLEDGAYIYKMDIDGSDAFIVETKKHFLDETLQLSIVEDRTTNEENHCAATERADLSKLDSDSALTFVVKTETHITGEISELPDIEDINRVRITMRRNYSSAAEGIDLPQLDPDNSGAFVMIPQMHVPKEISQHLEVEHSSVVPRLDTANSEPSGTSISMGTGEELSVDHQDKIQLPKQENDYFTTKTNDLSKPNPDINVTFGISNKTLVTEEMSQLLVNEDRITIQENQSVCQSGKDLYKLNPDITETFVKTVHTNVSKEISQLSNVEGRDIILRENIHHTTAEQTDLFSGVIVMANPTHVSEEMSLLPFVEDNKMDESFCNTDLNKFDHDGSGVDVMTNPTHVSEEMSLLPFVEDNKMDGNHCNTDIHKCDHDSSGVVVMTNPTHVSEEMPHLFHAINKDIIIIEETHCTGVDCTDQPTFDSDNTGTFLMITQECGQEKMSQLSDVDQSNTKKEIHHISAQSTDLQKLDLNKIEDFVIKTQALVIEENSQPLDVEWRNRNEVTKEENHGVKTAPKSLNVESNLGMRASPVCPQSSLHFGNFDNSLPSTTSALHESSIEPSTERLNKVVLGMHQTINDSKETEFNSSPPAISLSSLKTDDISSQLRFLRQNTKVAESASSHRPSMQKSVSFLDYPSPKKATMISESSKSVHQRLGPPVTTALPTISNIIQDAQHKVRYRSDDRELFSTQSPGGKSISASAESIRFNSRFNVCSTAGQVLADESSTFKTAAVATQHSPEFIATVSSGLSRYSNQPHTSPFTSKRVYRTQPKLPVHPRVLVPIRLLSDSEDDSDEEIDKKTDSLEGSVGQKGEKRDRDLPERVLVEVSNKRRASLQFQRKQDENLNNLEWAIPAIQTTFNSLKKKAGKFHSLKIQVENHLDKLRRKLSNISLQIIANEKLVVTHKILEDKVQNEIKDLLEKQKSLNTEKVQCAVSSRLTMCPQDVTENMILPDSDPSQESATKINQRLTRAQQMAQKKIYLKRLNEINGKIRQMKEYIAERKNEQASTVKKKLEKIQISGPEDNPQNVINTDEDSNPRVTEVEKHNSILEVNTNKQADFSVIQQRSSVTINLDNENMDLSGTSLFNAEQKTFDENRNDDFNLTLQLPVESQAPNLAGDQV